MNLLIILIMNGFLLASVLLILLIVMTLRNNKRPLKNRAGIRGELKKIKDQIEDSGDI